MNWRYFDVQTRCFWPPAAAPGESEEVGEEVVQQLRKDVAAASVIAQPRMALKARLGYTLLSVDFQQAELRLAAAYSGDSALLRCFHALAPPTQKG
jgi:hypothetical protein